MKVKCIRLLDADGREVESSSWLTLGSVYHVLSIFVNKNGRRSYGIVNRQTEGEWPQLGSHQEECFEVVSNKVPSNWCEWSGENVSGVSPLAWQSPGFYEAFYDHDPTTYPIFERERDLIIAEDP